MHGQTTTLDDLSILMEACSRNLPLELHYVNRDAAPNSTEPDILVARTRLIRMEGDTLQVDNAQQIGKEVRLRPNEIVDAFFTFNNIVYSFRTKVTAIRKIVDLNRRMRLIGAVLACPRTVTEGQRREDFRVSVAALDVIKVHLHETDPNAPNNCPINARRWTGCMSNISRGGFAVRLEGPEAHALRPGNLCFLAFKLPEEEHNLLFLGEVRYVREIPNRDSSIVGFQYLRWPDATTLRRQQNVIGRFAATVERNRSKRATR